MARPLLLLLLLLADARDPLRGAETATLLHLYLHLVKKLNGAIEVISSACSCSSSLLLPRLLRRLARAYGAVLLRSRHLESLRRS